MLPKKINKIIVPPIKCQGIKTKLVKFIAENIDWEGRGRWIEPFLGSGVVLFNIQPKKALIADTNKHIIKFYKDIQNGTIDEFIVQDYLKYCDNQLQIRGKDYYYEVREKFNTKQNDSLSFLFLNRSGFNGMMRFNRDGNFNVPYNHKDDRYRQAYITKIRNQVANVSKLMRFRDWEFIVSDWKDTLTQAEKEDFIYLDPPYFGRHTDYYNSWDEKDAIDLANKTKSLDCGFALSMWKENKYRNNHHLIKHWGELEFRLFSHFYHIGPTENLRNEIIEALAIKPENASTKNVYATV